MKGLSTFTVALVMAVTSSAFAAKTSAKASNSSVQPASAETSASTNTLAPPATSPSGQAASSTNPGTITAPVPAAAAKNWSVDIYGENYYTVANAEQGDGQMNALAFAGYNRKLNDKMKAYIRQYWTAAISGGKEKADSIYRFGDTEVGLGLGKIVEWNGGGIALTNRVYLPTGKISGLQGKIATFREDVTTSKELGKHFEIGHLLSPRLNAQSRDKWIGEDGKEAETSLAKLVQYAYATAKANDDLSATVALGTINTLTKRSGTLGANSYLDISASAQLTKAVALSVGVDSEPNQRNTDDKFLNNTSTDYYMNLSASM